MKEKPVKHKVLLTLDDEFYTRVSSEAELLGIGVATMCRILISEALMTRENRGVIMASLSKFKEIAPEQLEQILSDLPASESAPLLPDK